MPDRRQQVCHVKDCFVLIADLWQHHGICVAVGKTDGNVICEGNTFEVVHKFQLSAFLYRQNIFFEEGGFFPVVRLCSPLPVIFITPVDRIFKGRYQLVALSDNAATTMIEVEVCQEYVGNIIPVKAMCGEGFVSVASPCR